MGVAVVTMPPRKWPLDLKECTEKASVYLSLTATCSPEELADLWKNAEIAGKLIVGLTLRVRELEAQKHA